MSNQSNTSNDKPRTVQDVIRAIETKSAGGGYIYRGERKRHTKVSSNLYREYDIDEEHFDIEVVQTEMLSDAKKHIGDLPQDFHADLVASLNTTQEGTDKTINFEILTEIQHYGGKTNLIDFTTDYFIALFFACDGLHHKDGRVILQKTEEIKNMINHPRNPRHRVIAQKSVFVRPPKGFIEPREDDIVIIPANLKQLILQHLRTYHGISTETIYNDLYGFIRNQDIHGGAYTRFYKGFACQKRADEATTIEAKQKEYKKSIEHYTKAIELKPDFPEAYTNRGNAYGARGDYDRAIKDYNRAIQLKPDYANAYYNCGNVYNMRGDYDCAIQNYNRAIQLEPDFANAYCSRGVAYSDKGEYNHAIKDFNKAIELKPNYVEAYRDRGNTYMKKGDYNRAIKDFNMLIELNPNDAEACNNRGGAYYKKGDYDLAMKDYNRAIQLKPDHANAYNNRGTTYDIKGEYSRAIADYTKAIELDPDDANAYNNRGGTYYKKGDFDRAIEDYTKAIERDRNNAGTYYNRGMVWDKKSDFDHAIKDYDKAIELNHDFAEAYNNRGYIYYKKGEHAHAIEDYKYGNTTEVGSCSSL